jgi:hypothetical protein
MPDRFYIGMFYHDTYIARFFHHQKMLDIPPIPVSASDLLPCLEKLCGESFDVEFFRP